LDYRRPAESVYRESSLISRASGFAANEPVPLITIRISRPARRSPRRQLCTESVRRIAECRGLQSKRDGGSYGTAVRRWKNTHCDLSAAPHLDLAAVGMLRKLHATLEGQRIRLAATPTAVERSWVLDPWLQKTGYNRVGSIPDPWPSTDSRFGEPSQFGERCTAERQDVHYSPAPKTS
jgi:hypothetical protein